MSIDVVDLVRELVRRPTVSGDPRPQRDVMGVVTEVLRAQAQDARDEGRRALMERGGKQVVAMMVPVVFLVLPVTVVFAVYPGLAVLRLGL